MGNTYSSPAGRLNEVKGEMLRVAEPIEVLAVGCSQKKMPRNKGDNVTYRARIPTGGASTSGATMNRWSITAAAHQVTEGVTPVAESLSYRDVHGAINRHGGLSSHR